MQFPRWLSWLTVGFLAYLLIVGNTREAAQVPVEIEQPTQAEAPVKNYPKIRALVDGERWKKAIYPDYQSPEEACAAEPVPEGQLGSYAIILTEGGEEGAVCGEEIVVSVKQWGQTGKPERQYESIALILGQQRELDALLLGIRPGEERLIIFMPKAKIGALPALRVNTMQAVSVKRSEPAAATPTPDIQ